ncbi:MAG TPA: NAD(P)-binding protein [Hanamia sp.]|nr:NAD(P)-binding protein [Hanamia sp.]
MAIQKIAVLGGGMGSLTSVFQLTSDPTWQTKYDITVYQIGWRLGGKGASGRNNAAGERIEEHGLHLWFGFYDNAFNVIQQVYGANNRQPGTPLATWQEAFTGYDFICLEEQINGQWLHWPFKLWSNDLTPGIGSPPPSVEDYIIRLVNWISEKEKEFTVETTPEVKAKIMADTANRDLFKEKYSPLIVAANAEYSDAGKLLTSSASIAANNRNYSLLKNILDDLIGWLEKIAVDVENAETTLRRFFIMADLGVATIKGMIDDGVIENGFDVINNLDYREWLQKNGAYPVTINSAIVQAVYGLVFGGKEQYTFEAGTALRGLLRLGLTFKGHVYYRMMAGMGDAIFAPMYQVLQERGVKFQFFSKITNLGLGSDNSISTISIDIQATLANGVTFYDPLVTVNELPCWPNFPNTQYLQQGNEIVAGNVNLESYYSGWKPVAQQTLQKGTDFDLVILGISIGALPTVAKELIAKNTDWQNMVKNVIPVSTIAFQLWLSSSIQEMQWPFTADGLALLGSYQEPYDTWADMSDLIGRENWPAGFTPQNIAYFCGPTPQPNADEILQNALQSNFGDASFPATQTQMAQQFALDYLQQLSAHIWPGIWQGQNSFDFSKLIDINNGEGIARFNDQFFRANIDPTELYVMSFTGSSAYRLKTDQTSSFGNLYITGDWIDNGFNAGCIEATVMSGLQTANAISGENIKIPGEKDL